jgi:hypothetical protein
MLLKPVHLFYFCEGQSSRLSFKDCNQCPNKVFGGLDLFGLNLTIFCTSEVAPKHFLDEDGR